MAQSDIVYEDFLCPKDNGFFPHESQCDAYWSCKDGVPEFRLCGNGLAFDDTNDQFEDCNYIFTIDCTNRTELGRPTPRSKMAEIRGDSDVPVIFFFSLVTPNLLLLFFACA